MPNTRWRWSTCRAWSSAPDRRCRQLPAGGGFRQCCNPLQQSVKFQPGFRRARPAWSIERDRNHARLLAEADRSTRKGFRCCTGCAEPDPRREPGTYQGQNPERLIDARATAGHGQQPAKAAENRSRWNSAMHRKSAPRSAGVSFIFDRDPRSDLKANFRSQRFCLQHTGGRCDQRVVGDQPAGKENAQRLDAADLPNQPAKQKNTRNWW